jgi:phosphoserine phosphatase
MPSTPPDLPDESPEGREFPEPDSHAAAIADEILSLRDAHQELHGPGATYMVFLDLDGTILHGDVTEGLAPSEDHSGYQGLAEVAARAGLARGYGPGESGFLAMVADYQARVAEDALAGYLWGAARFADLQPESEAELRVLVEAYAREVLAAWVFVASREVLRLLHDQGVELHVVSASPTAFVHGAHVFLPEIPPARLSGIDRGRDATGTLRDPLVNYAEGKTARVQALLGAPGGPRVPLAGFGNCWTTDGPFLEWIASQGGLAVMINGGPPHRRFPRLRLVRQRAVHGSG